MGLALLLGLFGRHCNLASHLLKFNRVRLVSEGAVYIMNHVGRHWHSTHLRDFSFWILVALGVASCLEFRANAQSVSNGRQASASAGVTKNEPNGKSSLQGQKEQSSASAIVGGLTNGFPDPFKGHLLTRFSLAEGYDSGISNGSHTNAGDQYFVASASVSYDWQRRRSEYFFDYHASARRYNVLTGLDTVSHDLGLGQTLQLGPRTTWNFDHRYTSTPDYAGGLLRESVAEELFFANPLPSLGNSTSGTSPNSLTSMVTPLPLSNPTQDFRPPTDGLVTLRSILVLNSSQATLAHSLSSRTSLSFRPSFQRMRYQDNNLFGSDRIGFSAAMNRMLNERTTVGMTYQTRRFQQTGGFDLTLAHNVSFSISRQLTPRNRVTVAFGPARIRSDGRQSLSLSPILSNLLGKTALTRDVSQYSLAWFGNVSFLTNWQRIQFALEYSRSLSDMNLLSMAATSDNIMLSMGRQIGRTTTISGSVNYSRNQFAATRDVGRLDQSFFALNLTRRLSSTMDFSVFFTYAKLLTPVQQPIFLNHNQFGIRFVYHLPRVSAL